MRIRVRDEGEPTLMEEVSRAARPPREEGLSPSFGGTGATDGVRALALLRTPPAELAPEASEACGPIDPEAIYRRHGARVSRWAARLAGPGLDLDDIVHDVFLVVMRRWREFRGDAQISTWLHEITIRVVQAHRRKRRLRAWLWPFGVGALEGGGSPGRTADAGGDGRAPARELADDGLSPLESLERRQATVLLYRFLDQLDEKYRTAVVLFELEGVPCRQIAGLTGTTVANVWARVSRGREQLLRAFAKWEAAGKPRPRGGVT